MREAGAAGTARVSAPWRAVAFAGQEDLRHCVNVAELNKIIGEAGFEGIIRNILDEAERTKRATVRRLLNEHRRSSALPRP